MKKIWLRLIALTVASCTLGINSNHVAGQSNQLNNVFWVTEDKPNTLVNNKADNVITGKRKNSIQYYETFSVIESFKYFHSFADNGTYPLTKNIFVNIDGEYPPGYQPTWRIVGVPQQLEVNYECYTVKYGCETRRERLYFGLTEYQGKTVISFNAKGMDCVANIDLTSERVTLSETPTRFNVSSFRKKQKRELDDPNSACQSNADQTKGGWKGFVILSADNEGNIVMDLRLENYSKKGYLSYLWYDSNISIPNQMTPNAAAEKAIATANREKNEKREAEIYARQQKERKYFNEQYNQKVNMIKSKPSVNTIAVATYKGYVLKKTIDLSKLVGNTVSKDDGVEEAYIIAKNGYYSLIGAFDYDFKANKLEPHERDGQFALKYCLVKAVNSFAIDIATYALIGDKEKLLEIGQRLKNVQSTEEIVDETEQITIKGYLKSKN